MLQILDTIGKEFLLLLLELIESPNNDSDQDEIVIQLVNFILVYNLQFDKNKSLSENITVQALSEANNPKIFSETLSLLFNRASMCYSYSFPNNLSANNDAQKFIVIC